MTEKRNTKQVLIETALDLIWQSSYGSVSVDEICKTAAIKKGSFYHFFPSKADLAVAAIEEYWKEKQSICNEIFNPNISPIDRFKNLAKSIIEKAYYSQEKYGRVVGCPFTSLGSEMAGREDKIQTKINELNNRYKTYVKHTLEDAYNEGIVGDNTDFESKALNLHTYIMGQLTNARIENSLTTLERDLETGIMKILEINPIKKTNK